MQHLRVARLATFLLAAATSVMGCTEFAGSSVADLEALRGEWPHGDGAVADTEQETLYTITAWFPDGPRPVVVRDIDGWAVAGDLNFGRLDELLAEDNARSALLLGQKWPDAEVWYFIDESPAGFSSAEAASIVAAIDDLETYTHLNFIQDVVPTPAPAIHFLKSPEACFAPPGSMMPFPNTVNLNSDCALADYVVQHEVLHVLGFWHEQQRNDRDDHVEYFSQNVKAGWEINYQLQAGVTDKLDFEFDSVMIYDSLAASKNRFPTVVRKDAFTIREITDDGGGGYVLQAWDVFSDEVLDFDEDYTEFGAYEFLDFGCGSVPCEAGKADVWRAVFDPLTETYDWQILYADTRDVGWWWVNNTVTPPDQVGFADINGDNEADAVTIVGDEYHVSLSGTELWVPFLGPLPPGSSKLDPTHLRAADMDGDGCDNPVWDGDGSPNWEFSRPTSCPGPLTGADPELHYGQNPTVPMFSAAWQILSGIGPLEFGTNDIVLGDHTGGGDNRADILVVNSISWDLFENSWPAPVGPSVNVIPAFYNYPQFDELRFATFDDDEILDVFIEQASPGPGPSNLPCGDDRGWYIANGASGSLPFGSLLELECRNDNDGLPLPDLSLLAFADFGDLSLSDGADILAYGLYFQPASLRPYDKYNLQRMYGDTVEWSEVKQPASGPPVTVDSWETVRLASLAVETDDVAFGDFNGDCELDGFVVAGWNWYIIPGALGEPDGNPNYFQPGVQLWNEVPDLTMADLFFGNFTNTTSLYPPPTCDTTDVLARVWDPATSSYDFWLYRDGAASSPFLLAPAPPPPDQPLVGDLDGDGLDDLLSAFEASSAGNWWSLRETTPGNWNWQLECIANCWGHTAEHLALGNFDVDPGLEVFSDFWVTDPTRVRWYYFDITGDTGNNWNPLMETSYTFPDIAVGNFAGPDQSDVIRMESGTWDISPHGLDPWTTIGSSARVLTDVRLVDLDLDGDTDVLQTVDEWQ